MIICDFINFHYTNIVCYQKKYLKLEGVVLHVISVDLVRKQSFINKHSYSQAAFLNAGQMVS